jgi:electron transfer flavoprotein beta subunit
MVLTGAIKKLAEKEELAIIMCGRQTIDGDTAQVGPGIATRLGCSQLTLVDRVESVNLTNKIIKVRRKLEGRHEIVTAPLPVMIAVLREINTPRYPTVPMRLAADEAPITTWDNKIMNMDVNTIGLKGSATQVRKIFSPERAKSEILAGETDKPEDAAKKLIEKMVSKDLLSL